MSNKWFGAVLATAFLLAAASLFAAEPTNLARRGADDVSEKHEGEHHGGRGGVETAPAGPPADAKTKALFEAKCSICHPLSRPLGKNKDRKGWTEDVTRMQKVNGCPITDEEARGIIDYLVTIRGPVAR
jgi:cytochrome c5